MIIGVILNNFKCFKGLHYVPLTNANGSNFCGLIGLNGVGKSTVLEALDCVFNGKEMAPSVNAETTNTASYIIPICVIERKIWDALKINGLITERNEFGIRLSNAIINYYETKTYTKNVEIWQNIKKQCKNLNKDNQLLLPIFMQKRFRSPLGLFEMRPNDEYEIFGEIISNVSKNLKAKNILEYLDDYSDLTQIYIKRHIYIYIPQNISAEEFNILETESIQRLLSTDLMKNITTSLSQINALFRNFIKNYKEQYGNLQIDMKRQENLYIEPQKFSNYILHNLFSNFCLNIKTNGKDIPLVMSSSGEKKQAIIDLIYSVIVRYGYQYPYKLIVAVDEPENSLHIAQRFEQFNKLYLISQQKCQVFFTSHWFGFIPAIPDGCVVNIVRNNEQYLFNILNTYKYKEELKSLPVDIALKGNIDLVQTIISNILNEDCYNWMICEGTSDKVYLEGYLRYKNANPNLRIISVDGCANVRKIYNFLALALLEINKDDIKGKIFLMVDTDEASKNEYKKFNAPKALTDYDKKNIFRLRRLVNFDVNKETKLVNINGKNTNPTDIESVLNGNAFNNTLKKFEETLHLVSCNENLDNQPSAYTIPNKDALKSFFKSSRNKVAFAKAYVEEIQKGDYKVPSWIEDIKIFFKS